MGRSGGKRLRELIKPYDTISIIGMEKNVGKTTVLNTILGEYSRDIVLGITSIGRDGESIDRVSSTPKPKIWIEKGTIVATAREGLLASDITKEILATTGVSTPMGEVVVVRSISSGYIDLAGPSTALGIERVREIMLENSVNKVIVDGALNRMGTLYIKGATILSTGASLGRDLDSVVAKTKHRLDLLRLDEYSEDIGILGRVTYIGNSIRGEKLDSILGYEMEIIEGIKKGDRAIVLIGAVVETLVEKLIKNRGLFDNLTIVAQDGTKIFIGEEVMRKASMCGIDFKVLKRVEVVGITCNPVSPKGWRLDGLKDALKRVIDLPIIDVMEERDGIPR